MARLELIHYRPWTPMAQSDSPVTWQIDAQRRVAAELPQIFWSTGAGWPEVNLWALDRATVERSKPATVLSAMGHLKAYADFLEKSGLDWRHFPMRRDERVLDRFRGYLMAAVAAGQIALSTASVRMNAVVRFYRYADLHGLVRPAAPMWHERMVVLPFFDAAGFQRTMARITTSLGIPNRTRVGATLEDGLLPISSQATSELLSFTSQEASTELHLMLSIGFFTGARIGTIVSLTKECLLTAREDPLTPGFFLLPAGPGTDISTKFDVRGSLYFPTSLLQDLKEYSTSTERLFREMRASSTDKNALFLTRRSRKYSVESVDRLIHELRKVATKRGLNFMERFKFHQSRATYGTWLMRLMLDCASPDIAVDFVRKAMLHKHESTTLRYIRFIEVTAGKIQAARAFNEAFTGLKDRKWSGLPS